MSQHLYKSVPLEPLEGLAPQVITLVKSMMERDREKRTQTKAGDLELPAAGQGRCLDGCGHRTVGGNRGNQFDCLLLYIPGHYWSPFKGRSQGMIPLSDF
jgi:hypothetical protein